MSDSGRTDAQAAVLRDLFATGVERPRFPAGIAGRLRGELEDALLPSAGQLTERLVVTKGALADVLTCEGLHVARSGPFTWTAATARGTVAHRAIELGIFSRGQDLPPLEAVDAVLDAVVDDPNDGLHDFLTSAPPAEVAALRAGASEVATQFETLFPRLEARWRPRVESPVRVDLIPDLLVLRGRVDLALGTPKGDRAGVLLVDLKTGGPHGSHADDLRLYALLETLKTGTPPFRVASYYLESATWKHEDVTVELLEVACRRVVDGTRALLELRRRQREAVRTAGPACRWCPARATCPEGVAHEAARAKATAEAGFDAAGYPTDGGDDDDD